MADLKISVDMTDIPTAVQATQRFQRQINVLAGQLARGSITTGTYQKALQQLSREYSKLGVGINSAKSSIMSYGRAAAEAARQQQTMAVATQSAAVATQGSARGINRMGVLTQQAGYQIGDFIVQVQSGTNAFVAFGQQATQVAGTLTLLQGKWVLIGSALGIAIPLLTAIGAALMRTSQQSSGVNELSEALKTLAENAKEARQELNRISLGAGSAEEFTVLREISRINAEINAERERAEQQSGRNRRATLLRIEALESERAALERVIEIERARQNISDMANAAAQRYIDRTELLNDLERQYQLQLMINQFGEDSIEVERMRASQAREAFEIEARRLSVSENQYNSIMAAYDALARQEEIHRRNADEAERMNEILAGASPLVAMLVTELGKTREEAERAASAMEALMQFNSGNTVAQITAITRALSLSTAQAIELARVMPGYTGGGVAGPDAAVSQTQAMTGQGIGFRPDLPETPRGVGSGGGGGAEVQTIQEIIAARQQQISQELELLRLGGEQRRIREIQLELERSYRGDIDETGRAAISAAAQQIAAQEQVRNSLQQSIDTQNQLADSIAGSFGDAFMSMVDGTKTAKEAFKDMARQIISELFRVLVVQRMVNSLAGALGAGGAAGGFLGALVGARASGGSMMANSPYLVGEHGPEIVMPGRSGTVANADLTRKAMNGSDAVTVVNNINVTGGTDPAAIRQEVAKLMPQITNATKTAVIDARRRGGQMKAAFQ